VNEHRNDYKTAEQYLNEAIYYGDETLRSMIEEEETYLKCLETDTIIEIQFYTHSPIGFFKVVHCDIDAAIEEAIQAAEEDDQCTQK
jgi:hypothetical protein